MKKLIILMCITAIIFCGCSKKEEFLTETETLTETDNETKENIGSIDKSGLWYIAFSDKTAMLYGLKTDYSFDYYSPLIIPEKLDDEYTVTSIYKEVFQNSLFTEIVLPDTVEEIGDRVFRKSNIKKITVPASLKSLGEEVFDNCSELRECNFLSDFEILPVGTFSSCKNLEKVTLPKNLKVISDDAFFSCPRLENIQLPDTLEIIGTYAFADCTSLSIRYPEFVAQIGEEAFKNTKVAPPPAN